MALDQPEPPVPRHEKSQPIIGERCQKMHPGCFSWAPIQAIQVNQLPEGVQRASEIELAMRGENVGDSCAAQITEHGSEPVIHAVEVDQAVAGRDREPVGDGRPTQLPKRVNLNKRKLPVCFRGPPVCLRRNPRRLDPLRLLTGDKASDGI